MITVVTAMDGSDGDAGKGREGELTNTHYSGERFLVATIVLGGKMMEIHLMILHIDLLEMLTKDGGGRYPLSTYFDVCSINKRQCSAFSSH